MAGDLDSLKALVRGGLIPTCGELRELGIHGSSPEVPPCPSEGCKKPTGTACPVPNGMHYTRRDALLEKWRNEPGPVKKPKESLRILPEIRDGLTANHAQLQALADYWSLMSQAARTGSWKVVKSVLDDFHRKGGMAEWLFAEE